MIKLQTHKSFLKLLVSVLVILINVLCLNGKTINKTSPDLKNIGLDIEYFEDIEDDLEWISLINNQHAFKKNDSEVFTRIATNSSYWFSFKLKNKSSKDLWLELSNAHLSNIEFYKIDSDFQLVDSVFSSCFDRSANSEISGYSFVFPLAEKNDTNQYQFLIRAKSYMAMQVPLEIGSLAEITKNRNYFDYASLFFLGGMIILLLYNLFVFVTTRDNVYLYYILYLFVGTFAGTFISHFPVLEEFIGARITYKHVATWIWLVFGFTALFTVEYLKLKKTYVLFYKILVAEFVVFILLGIINAFHQSAEFSNIYQLFVIVFYLTCVAVGYKLMYDGEKRARYFSLGWTGFVLGLIIHLLTYNGLISYNYFFSSALYMGALFEALVFAIALGEIINSLRLKQLQLNMSLTSKNDELLSLNSSLDTFNYHVSHDLKTVLNNSQGLANMIVKYNSKGSVKKVNEITEKLSLVISNGLETVQSFLELGMVEGTLTSDFKEQIDVDSSIKSVLDLNGLNDSIVVSIDQNNIENLHMHSKAFESIFLNLFTNTIKYNENPPKAFLQFEESETEHCIKYRDNGIGIDLEKFGEELFMPFKRLKNNKKVEGTGVGLYLVKMLVQNHNGSINVASKLGEGTQFTIHLPIEVTD